MGKKTEIPEKIIQKMITEAEKAKGLAYAPYSHFQVGAALLIQSADKAGMSQNVNEAEMSQADLEKTDASAPLIITGCNIENASYPAGNCAERTALFKAVSEGYRSFRGIALVAGKGDGTRDYVSPCGICRQALREFVNPEDFFVIMAKSKEDYKVMTLEELLPLSFGPENLKS